MELTRPNSEEKICLFTVHSCCQPKVCSRTGERGWEGGSCWPRTLSRKPHRHKDFAKLLDHADVNSGNLIFINRHTSKCKHIVAQPIDINQNPFRRTTQLVAARFVATAFAVCLIVVGTLKTWLQIDLPYFELNNWQISKNLQSSSFRSTYPRRNKFTSQVLCQTTNQTYHNCNWCWAASPNPKILCKQNIIFMGNKARAKTEIFARTMLCYHWNPFRNLFGVQEPPSLPRTRWFWKCRKIDRQTSK